MSVPTRKVVLVTGASSGIGLASALDLLKHGHIVYGGARRVDEMQKITQGGGHALSLDVTDDTSMSEAVAQVLAEQGRIDVLVNNAGYGSYGAVEDIPMVEARHQIEVNIFGLARMTQLVTPHMRRQNSGRIINISSMGGSIWTPLGAWYHGTKWFVEGFTHALRLELNRFGIKAVIVAPGGINTGFNSIISDKALRTSGDGPYADMAKNLANAAKPDAGSDPQIIADAIRTAITAGKPKTIYRAGQYSRLLVYLAKLLPHRLFDRIVLSAVR